MGMQAMSSERLAREFAQSPSLRLLREDIYAEPVATAEENAALLARYQQTHDRAIRDEIVRRNLRLVQDVAAGYLQRPHDLSLSDLIAEGSIGLMRAIEHWDPARGTAFSTYATYWIRQACTRATDAQGQLIHQPYYIHELRRRLWLYAQRQNGGVPVDRQDGKPLPADETAAAALGVPLSRLREAEDAWNLMQPLSLAMPVGEESGGRSRHFGDDKGTLADLLPDDEAEDQLAHVLADEEASGIRAAIQQVLSPREWQVIALYYGLDYEGQRRMLTFDAIGEEMRLSRERIRQHRRDAFDKLYRAFVGTPLDPTHDDPPPTQIEVTA